MLLTTSSISTSVGSEIDKKDLIEWWYVQVTQPFPQLNLCEGLLLLFYGELSLDLEDINIIDKNVYNGYFLTVNQSMFTEIVEVANQWHCRAYNNHCPISHKRTCDFCLWAIDPGMNRKQLKNNRGRRFVHFYHKMRNRPSGLGCTDIHFLIKVKSLVLVSISKG